jgi:hypothetical protein
MHYFFRFLPLLTCFLPVEPSHAQAARSVSVVKLPFDLVGGLIVLRNLPLNGQSGDFILDTGCEYGLVVEQASFAGQLRPAATRGLSATGTVEQQQLAVTNFQFGATHYAGLTAVATSLAQIRGYVGPHLLGLVGYELLRDYEVVIDYTHRQLSCYPLRAARPAARPFVRQDSLAFTLAKGKPVVSGYIGKTLTRLMLDTGAMTNSLDLAFVEQLAPAVRPRLLGSREPFTGLGGQQQVQRAMLHELRLPPTTWQELPVMLVRLARPSSGRTLPYQGILGATFLGQDGVVSFHYGRQKFYTVAPTHQ